MRRRDGRLRLLAVGVSTIAHASVLLWVADTVMRPTARAPTPAQQTRVTLTFPTPPAPVPEEFPEPESKPPAPEPEPEPPKPKPEPKPEPKQKPKPKPKPKPTPPPPAQQPAQAPAVAERPVAGPLDPALVNRLREQYLGRLLAHIEAHKFYPALARRRGLEGVIQVSFILDENGRVNGVQVKGGHSLLQKAAEEAVRKAQPLPEPPKEVPCPLQVSYGMRFDLK